ncbi:MAG: translesion error-prone DNA polymerase V autoproteolytic subunit [Magnetococcales bacterium]|nr:translesion error-prone DNA polymerase V autoproteolytic subunit [Magnetococcales bacterium]
MVWMQGKPSAWGLPAGPQPLLAGVVPAGFPSPAEHAVEDRIDLNEHLVSHREATFFMRVRGNSMTRAGIHDGDLLVVDRSLEPVEGSVVIAVLDGAFTVKRWQRHPKGVLLQAANPGSADILVGPEQELVIWGVVRWAIHRV